MKEIDSYLCPVCGGEVPVGSAACPGCGPRKVARRMRKRKQKRGRIKHPWEQDSSQDGLGLDLSSSEFDYEDFVEREFGSKPHRQIGIAWYWWLTAIIVLTVFILSFIAL